ncbi:uncharacterized protein FOMMEDRAFT_104518 [Fomitiporia mediterranea MF3/22]|uniref:uncharacterized protein n=1 Tax=Fomitiporia mediterranea (strain MF3/22) TaxID=694068 RepID=UPI000440957C|nr:uncharacterized protein FOMMEDRAFT_104518 [Fomitiporia mediterranea MF3/22]EJD06060.1 hypothetical protein FOMMEDRAFT_104518 [Fomitiporia mediterranea MF3/22]
MSYVNGKIDLTPRRHHGYAVFLFILGTLLPPLAVAARFGIGKDFWLNLLLTICGYIPGHGHNFYIQNIRNNKNHRRTPKWAQRYGLVDTTKIESNKKRSQWASRYNDRLPHSALEGQEYAEGEIPDANGRPDSILEPDARARRDNQQLWTEQDERYYGQRNSVQGSGRWHYPANFEDTLPADGGMYGGVTKKKKKGKKDRWARTEDAYAAPPKKRKSKKTKGRSTVGGAEHDGVGASEYDRRSSTTSIEDTGFPEDPEGGLYGERNRRNDALPDVPPVGAAAGGGRQRDVLDHEF